MVSFDDFKKIDLRIATILSCTPHPDADRLLVLTCNVGELGDRQIVAGIKGAYQPDDLVGQQIVMVTNLEPATIRGVQSQGMLLAAKDENGLSVVAPHKQIAPGAKVS